MSVYQSDWSPPYTRPSPSLPIRPTRAQHRDWMEYWRLLFKEVTLEDIKSFESSFKGGEEEREALRAAYLKCHGDMDGILDEVSISGILCWKIL